MTKEHSVRVATALNDPLFQEYQHSLNELKSMRTRHELVMLGIRFASAMQAYHAYLTLYKFAASSSAPAGSSKLMFAGARIAAFLVIGDTLNFNYYYSGSKLIVDNHESLKEEYEKRMLEQQGHPDSIYLKSPIENPDSIYLKKPGE